ncbi:unnamed protein product [Cochlearia groenlandica]
MTVKSQIFGSVDCSFRNEEWLMTCHCGDCFGAHILAFPDLSFWVFRWLDFSALVSSNGFGGVRAAECAG